MFLFSGQVSGKRFGRPGAVAHGVLYVAAQLRERLAQAFGSEHGVVAESFGSLARGGYFAFHNAFEKMFPSFFY